MSEKNYKLSKRQRKDGQARVKLLDTQIIKIQLRWNDKFINSIDIGVHAKNQTP